MKTPWQSIIPELPTADLAAAIRYFETYLGFTVEFALPEIGYGKISRDGHELFLAQTSAAFEPRTCMIYTEDIESTYREMQESKVTIASELRKLDVGSTEFSIRICDGHIFTFFH